MSTEVATAFQCEGEWLYGVLHRMDRPVTRGVLVVVGGPQFRVGSHRQFVLLARGLATAGVPVMRFDYRGMGDSTGETRSFEAIDADIRAAIEHFCAVQPGLREVTLWGLCDAASAALFYAPSDVRVAGVVLLNPWVRTEAGIAGTYLTRYYRERLSDPNFWRKLFQGEFHFIASLRSLLALIGARLGVSAIGPQAGSEAVATSGAGQAVCDARAVQSLPDRMLEYLGRYRGRVLLILSGDDLTAEEFRRVVRGSRAWRRRLGGTNVTQHELKQANHTFSRKLWRDQVATLTRKWLESW